MVPQKSKKSKKSKWLRFFALVGPEKSKKAKKSKCLRFSPSWISKGRKSKKSRNGCAFRLHGPAKVDTVEVRPHGSAKIQKSQESQNGCVFSAPGGAKIEKVEKVEMVTFFRTRGPEKVEQGENVSMISFLRPHCSDFSRKITRLKWVHLFDPVGWVCKNRKSKTGRNVCAFLLMGLQKSQKWTKSKWISSAKGGGRASSLSFDAEG